MQIEGITLQRKSLLTLGFILLLFSISCRRQQALKVIYMPPADYPVEARSKGMEGVVVVTVGIETDGKVLYSSGKGANAPLVQAAERNAKGWIFEVPAHATFPLEHKIRYLYKFDKEGGANLMPTISTELPDVVEIIATPASGDKFILTPPKVSKIPAGSAPKS